MSFKNISITALALFITLLPTTGAMADEAEGNGAPELTYLDSLPGSQGELSLIFKLDASNEDSLFFGRYQDPFESKSFFIEKFDYLGWASDKSIFDLDLSNTWSPSWRGSSEYKQLGEWRLWGESNYYKHFEIPSRLPAERNDLDLGFEWGSISRNNFTAGYTYKAGGEALSAGDRLYTIWETKDVNLGYDFNIMDWAAKLTYKRRAMDGNITGLNDVTHNTWDFRAGRGFGDKNYVEGNILYNTSDVDSEAGGSSVRVGAYARFLNALGIDRLNLTSRLSWDKRGAGPSRMHPEGDIGKFNIGAKWKAAPNLSLNGSLDIIRADKSHPDRNAALEFFANPALTAPVAGSIIGDTVSTYNCKLGGRWAVSDNFDAVADWSWIQRRGLYNASFPEAGSAYLWWSAESHNAYALRYRPGKGRVGEGNWQFKYTTNDRSSAERSSSSDDEHFTIDWTGPVTDSLWAYFGGGFLRTNSVQPELMNWEQKGKEYGGGLTWDFAKMWSLHGDFWKYDVTGADGYDQNNIKLGIDYKLDKDWDFGIEYDKIDGDFDSLMPLDYNVKLLLLKLDCKW